MAKRKNKLSKSKKKAQIPCYEYHKLWNFEPKQCCYQRLCSSCKTKLSRIILENKKWKKEHNVNGKY